MIGLIFQNELVVTKQLHQKSVIFVIIVTFYLCNGCHDLMQKDEF